VIEVLQVNVVEPFGFQGPEEGFRHGVVPAISLSAHALDNGVALYDVFGKDHMKFSKTVKDYSDSTTLDQKLDGQSWWHRFPFLPFF
jgi:hypothetical protein